MKLGFSLSPGGLLLPYHLGALECLEHQGVLVADTPVAGSSAGAIATLAHGCGLDKRSVLEATISVSNACQEQGGARGRLLPLLQQQMERLVGPDEFEYLTTTTTTTTTSSNGKEGSEKFNSSNNNNSSTNIGIAYKEVFPNRRNILQTTFSDRQDLFNAVSYSCMFPFFATNWPCIWDTSQGLWQSRLVVDGFFTVPQERLGCPDWDHYRSSNNEDEDEETTGSSPKSKIDRTVGIACFPQSSTRLTAFAPSDCISPSGDDMPLPDLIRLATQASSRDELTQVYELGYRNAEAWCAQERQQEGNEQRVI